MDTIIYLYRWRAPELNEKMNLQRESRSSDPGILQKEDLYRREDYDLQDYHLVKIGMSEHLLRICHENTFRQNSRRNRESGGFFERKRQKRRHRQDGLLLAEFLQDIQSDADNGSFVCEEPIAYFAGREFNGYFQASYVRHLLKYRGFVEPVHHFIILGQTACIPELVYELVNTMKSLKWILPRRLYRREQQELVDTLYEEYGLAVEVKVFEEEESFAMAYPVCRMPSVVLDFSEADRVPTADVARGSIWLDMGASEEKRRRIEDRDTGIHYFSLKKEWKQPQKALNYLDTTSKNGYNT